MARFVQLIEFTTSRIDDVHDLVQEARANMNNSLVRAAVTADVDRPKVNISEFESPQAAAQSANTPESADIVDKIAALCDKRPRSTPSKRSKPGTPDLTPGWVLIAMGGGDDNVGLALRPSQPDYNPLSGQSS